MTVHTPPQRAIIHVSDPTLRRSLCSILQDRGFSVHSAKDPAAAARALARETFDCVLVEGDRAPPSVEAPARTVGPSGTTSPLLDSRAPAMHALIDTLSRAAASSVPVLLRGESGTGKGVLAEWVHARGARAGRPFVVVNCPALSDDLLTAELFGHTRGAFTGAVRDKPGRVEVAEGGTLFLDEIGDLSPALQVKLLRFLQDQTFERVGDVRTRRANVRIVAATSRDLEADVQSGRLRVDLYYRLNVVEVRVPALRERPEDLTALAEHLLRTAASAMGRAAPTLDESARMLLLRHHWPGNVRELKNEIDRAMALCPDSVLRAGCFSERLCGAARAAGPQLGGDHSLREIEREHIDRVLARAVSLEAAAQVLGIDDSTLWRKRKRWTASSARTSGHGALDEGELSAVEVHAGAAAEG